MKSEEVETDAGQTGSIVGEGCPECGAPMTEVFRAQECGMVFVWLECSRKGCPGKALRKMESRAMLPLAWVLGHNAPPETARQL